VEQVGGKEPRGSAGCLLLLKGRCYEECYEFVEIDFTLVMMMIMMMVVIMMTMMMIVVVMMMMIKVLSPSLLTSILSLICDQSARSD
jgi:hypothetical protein